MVNKKESVEIASKQFKIRDRTERIFRVFLGKVFPDANISYEPESFSAINYHFARETTRPDFRVIRPQGKTIYIEITKDRRNGTDPKLREKEIMKKAAPNCIYVVLYGETLLKIQKKYEEFNFFKSKKKKVSQSDLPQNKAKKLTIRTRVEMGNKYSIFSTNGRH